MPELPRGDREGHRGLQSLRSDVHSGKVTPEKGGKFTHLLIVASAAPPLAPAHH